MTEPAQHAEYVAAVEDMDLTIRCLRLELPQEVWHHVQDKWATCRALLIEGETG